MKRLPGRLWLKDRTSGIEWSHRLVSYETLKRLAGKDCYAFTTDIERVTYYHDAETDDSLGLLYCHELIHRINLTPGVQHILEKFLHQNDLDDHEESAADFYGRALWETLRPYLRLPRPPRRVSRSK